MKSLILASFLLLGPALSLAVDAASTEPKAAAAKPKAKAVVKKAAPAAKAKKPVAAAVAEPVPEVIVLTPEEKAIADRVYTGNITCELGATVQVTPDAQSSGSFFVSGKGFKYHMRPVHGATSAVRLEDQRSGAVWIQIANKSMLMNQKLGQRMADECMSEQQAQVTQAMKSAPPQSLFDSAPAGSR